MIRAGLLRHWVAVEGLDSGLDDFGQPTGTWNMYAERMARIETISGHESFSALQKWPEANVVITVRGDAMTSAIKPQMRVRYADPKIGTDKVYNILAVLDIDERGIEIQLICQKEG